MKTEWMQIYILSVAIFASCWFAEGNSCGFLLKCRCLGGFSSPHCCCCEKSCGCLWKTFEVLFRLRFSSNMKMFENWNCYLEKELICVSKLFLFFINFLIFLISNYKCFEIVVIFWLLFISNKIRSFEFFFC